MNAKTKKTLSVVANVLLWVFLAFAVVVTVYATIVVTSSDGVPSVGGNVMITVQTPSMEGERGFSQGSLIFSKKLTREEAHSLGVDDVITFWAGDLDGDGTNDLNTHRIVEVVERTDGYTYYRTKGDNNPLADEKIVSDANVVALWNGSEWKGVGAILTFLTSSVGFLCVIVLPLLIFFGFEVFNFVKVVRQVRGKKTITAEDEEEIKRRAVEEYLRQQQAEKTAVNEEPASADASGDKSQTSDGQEDSEIK